ncbi:hypothetical protein J2W83_000924 [Pseudomonas hunanensis]|uniref:Uncharacterized protein n=1 Tax=Pseudomonas hunanensis TaxID=1247546 RepID=A0ACC6JYQ7_9PSED|nr:hypothetical protein [Pseudomonas sp. BP8]MDR6711330.1 hypothetical protein [Pseudomonas hunanensis]
MTRQKVGDQHLIAITRFPQHWGPQPTHTLQKPLR